MKCWSRSIGGVLLAIMLVASFATCRNSTTGKSHPVGPATLNGAVTFGPLHDADVKVFSVKSDGTNGTQIGATVTAVDGSFSLTFTTRPIGAVRVVVTGGVFKSEFDDTDVDIATCTFSYLLDALKGGANNISMTPVTDFINSLTVGQLANQPNLKASHTAARALLESFYGMTSNPETLAPSFAAAAVGTEAFKYGMVLGGLDTLAQKLAPADRCTALMALSQDITDGLFDGLANGTAVPLGAGNLPSTAGTSDFLTQLTNYQNNGKAITDQGIDPLTLTTTVGDIKTGVSGSSLTPPAVGISAGSSGAISTLAFNGKQYVYVAARTSGVVRIDVTDPVATSPTIDVWVDLYNTTFSGQEIGGVVPLVGAAHPQLFVFAYGSKHFALVDADTGLVDQEGDLAIVATNAVGFSGGSAFIAGGIPDTGRDGVWLATADGYYFFNRVTLALETLYPVDSTNFLAENLGGDIGHSLLWCPNYGADYEGAVQLIDLVANKSYYMDDASFDTYFRSNGITECDAGSVDASFQVGIITNEDSPDVGFVNLQTITKKDNVAPTLSTFTPATSNGAVHVSLGASFQPTISGSAVDGSTHLVLMMAGYSDDIAVGLLEKPAEAGPGKWKGLTDWRYNTLTNYTIARDPHAVAAFLNLSNSKAYGYLLDGSTLSPAALQIDLAAVLALTPDAGGDGHLYTGDLTTTGQIIRRGWTVP